MSAQGVRGPIVAITGTPGTGKTTIGARLREAGHPVIDLKTFGGDERFDQGEDPLRPGTRILDQDALSDHLRATLHQRPDVHDHDGPLFIESHFAHELDLVDRIVVLRCRPSVLRERLETRGWSDVKVRENLEAEALDLIVQEALAVREDAAGVGETVALTEVDTTERALDDVVRDVVAFATGPPDRLEIGTVDWSDEVLGWY